MRDHLETNLSGLKEKLAAIEKKLENQPGSGNLRNIRRTYVQAIRSAERTLEAITGLDPVILNTVVRLKKLQES